MTDLKICRICLRTEAKVYKFTEFQLQSYYEEVTATKLNSNDSLPQCFCYECAMMLHKFHKFKEKCYVGQKILKELLWKGPITYQTVYHIDRVNTNLQSSVGPMTVTENVKSFFMIQLNDDKKPVIKNEENSKKNKTDDSKTNDDFDSKLDDDIDNDLDNMTSEPESPTAIFIDEKNGTIKLETEQIKEGKKSPNIFLDRNSSPKFTISSRRTRYLDANNWKLTNLSEDEAVKQFRQKCEDGKYLKALYKCTSCFKGFSKSSMLQRHNDLRHNESLGTFECRYCRQRFKFASHLRLHMRRHFTCYRCLRCPFSCDLENTALLHEEYHSGATKKCLQCGEEFRHASTFYTHMRTRHRSAHVCVVCGVSCVSAAGLIQHIATSHRAARTDSQSEEEEVATYCERCDINFDSTKAFVEHFFHSIQHAEGVEHELKDEITIPRKVQGKKLKAKVEKQIRKRPEEPPFIVKESKKKKKSKRDRRKPSTCHQCGLHFATQAACMKHHVAEHPRTSFYSHTRRYVCELCGASLAPGSVATHRNMHSREVTHACHACGKQFHSSVSYKRHLVTHTGEKKFACTLCDKRFTQSNSMKLHYKTFHLKQPYPKRNRRKNKEPTSEASECGSGGEGPLPPPTLPPPPPPGPAPPAIGGEEHVQYLTLR